MRTLLAVCLLLSLIMTTKMSHAECKIIEHEGRTEVVCLDEPLTDAQIKEKENTRRNNDQSNNKQQLERERNQREEAKIQEKKDIERCSLDYSICLSSTRDNMRCMGEQARCEKNIIANSPIQDTKTCKKLCSSDYAICLSSSRDNMRCMGEQARCEKQCL